MRAEDYDQLNTDVRRRLVINNDEWLRVSTYLSDLNILYSQLIWTFSRQCVTRLGSGFVLLKGNGVTLPPLPVRGAISSPFGVARAAKAL